MERLLGRDTELAQIQDLLRRAQADKVAGALRLSGEAGMGKTALLHAGEACAREAGWLVARVDVHRIQGTLPMVAARRLADGLLGELGDRALRYAGGLPVLPDQREGNPAGFREGVVRLVEGVLHDFPVVMSVDDAQWIDPESRSLIEDLLRSFSDHTIALLATERTTEGTAFGDIAEAVNLGPVAASDAAALVAEHYPQAPPEVVEGILVHAKGRPLEIVALAQSARESGARDAEGVHASVRVAIARDLNQLPAPVREFLQLCSLIAEPIDYATLLRIWPEETVSAHITSVANKYLVQDGLTLRFVHAAIADSVRQTMPVEIPYRRKILAALTSIETPTLEEYERIVQQALACGDTALAHKNLLLLAKHATRASALFTASSAYERAFAIALPPTGDLVHVYLEYASVLNMQGRLAEAGAILERALADTTAYNITENTGSIAALFLVAQWGAKGYRAALESAEPLLRRFQDPADRLQLLSVTVWLHACADDEAAFQQCKRDLIAREGELSPELRMRLAVAEAYLSIHRGEVERAESAIERAVAEAGAVASPNRRSAEVSRAAIHFLRHGPRDIDPILPRLRVHHQSDRSQMPIVEYVRAVCAFARGEMTDARDLVFEALGHAMDRQSRVRLLGVDAALAAVSQEPSQREDEIREILANFTGSASDYGLLPIASWHAASVAVEEPVNARALLRDVLRALAKPGDVSTLNFPVALSLAAARLKDRESLERLYAMSDFWEDRAPWMLAQSALASGYAGKALGKSGATAVLSAAQQAFKAFDAPLFAAIARFVDDPKDAEAIAFFSAQGIRSGFLELRADTGLTHTEPRRKGSAIPSRREMEIIALVADGQTNRRIAQTLFLSERTVEVHIASVFNKLNVSSRTQVAAWYFTTQGTTGRPPHAPDRTYSRPV